MKDKSSQRRQIRFGDVKIILDGSSAAIAASEKIGSLLISRVVKGQLSLLKKSKCDIALMEIINLLFKAANRAHYAQDFVANGGIDMLQQILLLDPTSHKISFVHTFKSLVELLRIDPDIRDEIYSKSFFSLAVLTCESMDQLEKAHLAAIEFLSELALARHPFFVTNTIDDPNRSSRHGVAATILRMIYSPRPLLRRLSILLGVSVWQDEKAVKNILQLDSLELRGPRKRRKATAKGRNTGSTSHRPSWLDELVPQLCRQLVSQDSEAIQSQYEAAELVVLLCTTVPGLDVAQRLLHVITSIAMLNCRVVIGGGDTSSGIRRAAVGNISHKHNNVMVSALQLLEDVDDDHYDSDPCETMLLRDNESRTTDCRTAGGRPQQQRSDSSNRVANSSLLTKYMPSMVLGLSEECSDPVIVCCYICRRLVSISLQRARSLEALRSRMRSTSLRTSIAGKTRNTVSIITAAATTRASTAVTTASGATMYASDLRSRQSMRSEVLNDTAADIRNNSIPFTHTDGDTHQVSSPNNRSDHNITSLLGVGNDELSTNSNPTDFQPANAQSVAENVRTSDAQTTNVESVFDAQSLESKTDRIGGLDQDDDKENMSDGDDDSEEEARITVENQLEALRSEGFHWALLLVALTYGATLQEARIVNEINRSSGAAESLQQRSMDEKNSSGDDANLKLPNRYESALTGDFHSSDARLTSSLNRAQQAAIERLRAAGVLKKPTQASVKEAANTASDIVTNIVEAKHVQFDATERTTQNVADDCTAAIGTATEASLLEESSQYQEREYCQSHGDVRSTETETDITIANNLDRAASLTDNIGEQTKSAQSSRDKSAMENTCISTVLSDEVKREIERALETVHSTLQGWIDADTQALWQVRCAFMECNISVSEFQVEALSAEEGASKRVNVPADDLYNSDLLARDRLDLISTLSNLFNRDSISSGLFGVEVLNPQRQLLVRLLMDRIGMGGRTSYIRSLIDEALRREQTKKPFDATKSRTDARSSVDAEAAEYSAIAQAVHNAASFVNKAKPSGASGALPTLSAATTVEGFRSHASRLQRTRAPDFAERTRPPFGISTANNRVANSGTSPKRSPRAGSTSPTRGTVSTMGAKTIAGTGTAGAVIADDIVPPPLPEYQYKEVMELLIQAGKNGELDSVDNDKLQKLLKKMSVRTKDNNPGGSAAVSRHGSFDVSATSSSSSSSAARAAKDEKALKSFGVRAPRVTSMTFKLSSLVREETLQVSQQADAEFASAGDRFVTRGLNSTRLFSTTRSPPKASVSEKGAKSCNAPAPQGTPSKAPSARHRLTARSISDAPSGIQQWRQQPEVDEAAEFRFHAPNIDLSSVLATVTNAFAE